MIQLSDDDIGVGNSIAAKVGGHQM
jgi:hypothetical protein